MQQLEIEEICLPTNCLEVCKQRRGQEESIHTESGFDWLILLSDASRWLENDRGIQCEDERLIRPRLIKLTRILKIIKGIHIIHETERLNLSMQKVKNFQQLQSYLCEPYKTLVVSTLKSIYTLLVEQPHIKSVHLVSQQIYFNKHTKSL